MKAWRKRSVFSIVYAPEQMPESRRRRKIEFRRKRELREKSELKKSGLKKSELKKSELREKSGLREKSELREKVLLWANAVERSPVEDLWQKEEQEAIQREEAAQW